MTNLRASTKPKIINIIEDDLKKEELSEEEYNTDEEDDLYS